MRRARRPAIHLAPHIQRLLLQAAQDHAHQPLGNPPRPPAVITTRARQLPAQHLGRRPHPLPPRLDRRPRGVRIDRRAGSAGVRVRGPRGHGGSGILEHHGPSTPGVDVVRPAHRTGFRLGFRPSGRRGGADGPTARRATAPHLAVAGLDFLQQPPRRALQPLRLGGLAATVVVAGVREPEQGVRRAPHTRLRDLPALQQTGRAVQDPVRVTQQIQRPLARLPLRGQRRSQRLVEPRQSVPPAGGISSLTYAP
ncbi:hypothetical protein ABT186_41280 [Streptomyces sp. NPDC001634]|uniref:hypothetical protein n=1 Tax=Streptomyces sp. NPDC001634 TaxID=3154390 RepID=UPI003327328C